MVVLGGPGTQCDETLGYPDVVGYRGGIAGIFRPFDVAGGRAIDLLGGPACDHGLCIVGPAPEGPSRRHPPDDGEASSHIGGVFSVLFHPGVFFNPEFPEYFGVYRRNLQLFRDQECRGETATSLMLRARSLERVRSDGAARSRLEAHPENLAL